VISELGKGENGEGYKGRNGEQAWTERGNARKRRIKREGRWG